MASILADDGLDWEIPVLDGPDEYHVYASRDPDDDAAAAVLSVLEREGFSLYKDDPNQAKSDNVEMGIDCSRNVIFLMTSSTPTQRNWLSFEMHKAFEKVTVRGRGSVIVVNDNAIELPSELREFKRLQYSENKLFRKKLLSYLIGDPHPPMETLSKHNFGSALAYSYFYGYLKFVLPALHERVKKCGMMASDGDSGRNMSQKMFVVMPESCWSPTNLKDMDSSLTFHSWIPFKASRGGVVDRDYKSAVYSLKDAETGKEYFLVMELATPLATLLDMYQGSVSGISLDERNREMRQFYFQLKALLSHQKYKHLGLHRKAVIIYYKDLRENHNFGQILLKRLKKEIAEEVADEAKTDAAPGSSTAEDYADAADSKVTVQISDSRGNRVILDQELIPAYGMKAQTRGVAMVINNTCFTNLSQRAGSNVDERKITALFGDFHFELETHHDKTAAEMSDLVAGLASRDHTQYDAVICCIMSHGQLGKVFGTDGRTVEITKLADRFASADTLWGKPKMFFIQACQGGEEKDGTDGTDAGVTGSGPQHTEAARVVESGDDDTELSRVPCSVLQTQDAEPEEIPSAEEKVLLNLTRHKSLNEDSAPNVTDGSTDVIPDGLTIRDVIAEGGDVFPEVLHERDVIAGGGDVISAEVPVSDVIAMGGNVMSDVERATDVTINGDGDVIPDVRRDVSGASPIEDPLLGDAPSCNYCPVSALAAGHLASDKSDLVPIRNLDERGAEGQVQMIDKKVQTNEKPIQTPANAPYEPKPEVEVHETDAEVFTSKRRSQLVPGSPDFLMSYSTLPGSLSFRTARLGSFYIKALDENVRRLSNQMPLDRILMQVTKKVEEEVEQNAGFPALHLSKHQFPFHLHTMDKLVYFER